MTGFAIHAYTSSDRQGKRVRNLQLFLYSRNLETQALDESFVSALDDGSLFDAIVVVVHPIATQAAYGLLTEDNVFRDRLLDTVSNDAKKITVISFDPSEGVYEARDVNGTLLRDSEEHVHRHRRISLLHIFSHANGLLSAPRGYHYKKPSGAHANRFLRASNVLEDGRNIELLTFWLFGKLHSSNITQIVVDTSGIAAVAVSLAHWAMQLSLLTSVPTVMSHGSYGGLNKLRISAPDRTLVIISASTSGNMAEKLLKKGAVTDLLITLFYLADKPCSVGETLCDLKKESADGDGFDIVENFKEKDCPYCAERSCPVTIEGDQFTLEPPRQEYVLLGKNDLPRAQAEIIDKYSGLDFFKAHRTIEEGNNQELFLNVSALFPAVPPKDEGARAVIEEIKRKWQQTVKRSLAINVNTIVYTSYPFSKELAEAAQALFKSFGDSAIKVVSSASLRDEPASYETAAVVISGCLDDFDELRAVNRDLRDKQPRCNTTYIGPVLRASSSTEREQIFRNITFGELGQNTFSLFRVEYIELPKNQRRNSWQIELRLLQRIQAWADRTGLDTGSEIPKRIERLQQAPAEGLSDDLFWPSPQNRSLDIRADFTFIDTAGGTRKISQADIFALMSTLLHRLREGVPGKPRLIYRPYERALISPDNFQQFNDGILRAAILRSARGYELAYGNDSDRQASERLYSIIASQIRNQDKPEGEALPEFIIAILSRRLSLYSVTLPRFHGHQTYAARSARSNCTGD